MKKFLWAGIITVAVLLLSLLAVSLFVRSYLKSERLTSTIVLKAEEFTGRRMSIDQIHVSLFKGIIVKGIRLKEREGTGDFISTKEFILDYDLIPLLKRQLVIKRVEFVSPSILVTRGKDGKYNFSDIIEKDKGTRAPSGLGKETEREFPFSVVTDRIIVRDAKFEFKDEKEELPDFAANADMELRLSAGRSLKDLSPSGNLTLRELRATVNGIPTSASGKIELDSASVRIDLAATVNREPIKVAGSVKDYRGSPDVTLNFSAGRLDVEKLLPPESGKKEDRGVSTGRNAPSQKADTGRGSAGNWGKVSGEVKVDTLKYRSYTIKDFIMNYHYRDGGMTIEPLRLGLAGGEQVNAEGVLKGALKFRYPSGETATASGIKKSLTGKGSLDLSKCEVRRSKVTDAMALLTGLEDLRSPRFDNVHANFDIRNQKVFLDSTMNSPQIRLNPSGSIDFDQRIDVITDLKISPLLAAKLPSADITRYIKDEDGWTVLPLKVAGTAEKPSVSLNSAAMKKRVGKGIQGEIERSLLKGEPQRKDGQQPPKEKGPQDLFKGIFGK